MAAVDEDYAEDLRAQARDVVGGPVADDRGGDAEQIAVDRDVEATIETIGGMSREQFDADAVGGGHRTG